MENIVKLAIDNYKGRVQKYSTAEANELLHKALVEANNGSEILDIRAIRDGKCNGLFTLLETILEKTAIEGLMEDDFFNALVDIRNVAAGDKPEFVIKDSNLFIVDEAADGTQSVRRQRIGGQEKISFPTSRRMIRIYEELERILANRVNMNDLIDIVAKSFRQKMLNEIYSLWAKATANDLGGAVYFPAAGSYNEDVILDIISHVEAAANGKPATIVGTKKALRKLKESIVSDSAKDELHNFGYVGKFFGTPVVALPQRHKIGSTNFVFDDKVLHIIAGDDKPIKFIYEGDALIINGNPLDNADLTQEYLYSEKYGLGIALAGGNAGIGRFEFAN